MAIPEPIPKRSDVHKVIRTAALNRIAHFGMMLDQVQKKQATANQIFKFAASGDTNVLTAPAEEQDMGVQIGNEIHYHYTGNGEAVEEAPATIPIDGAEQPQQPLWEAGPKPLTWWQKGLIAAGGLGSAIGLAALAEEYYYGRPTPPAVVDTDTDTDNITEIYFPD